MSERTYEDCLKELSDASAEYASCIAACRRLIQVCREVGVRRPDGFDRIGLALTWTMEPVSMMSPLRSLSAQPRDICGKWRVGNVTCKTHEEAAAQIKFLLESASE